MNPRFNRRVKSAPMPLIRSESALQMACAAFLDRTLDPAWRWWHTPNGGMRSKATAGKLKAEGVKAGVPDIIVMGPGGRAVFIELKAQRNTLTPDQTDFQRWATGAGYPFFTVRSLDGLTAALNDAGVPVRGVLS